MYFSSHGLGLIDLHILSTFYLCVSVITNFSLRELRFFDSSPSGIFNLMPPSWGIFLHLFMWVGFFWITSLEHILSCTSIMMDFSLHDSGFLKSHSSSIFYLMSPSWLISLHTNHVFFLLILLEHILPYVSTIINFSSWGLGFPDSHSTLCLCCSEFFFAWVKFSWLMCLEHILPCASI